MVLRTGFIVLFLYRFTGTRCEALNSSCDLEPCYHDGVCVSVITGGVECACSENYLGPRCEAMRRYCTSQQPCQNGGLCVDIRDGEIPIQSYFCGSNVA